MAGPIGESECPADVNNRAEYQDQAAEEGDDQRQDARGGFCALKTVLRRPKQATKPARMVSKNTVAP